MIKTIEDSIKKNLNHVMMVQKEKKRGSIGRLPRDRAKARKNISIETSSSKPKTKGKFDPSPDEECFHCHKRH
jgi:hypothetical protein